MYGGSERKSGKCTKWYFPKGLYVQTYGFYLFAMVAAAYDSRIG